MNEDAAIVDAAFEPVAPNVLAVQVVRMLVFWMTATAQRIERAVAARVAVQFMKPAA